MEPNTLTSLERLKLERLNGPEVLWKGVLPRGCLANLKSIFVTDCKCLKRLFSFKTLQQLKNIEVIKVSFRNIEIEEISSSTDGDDQRDDTTIDETVLPKLHNLLLWELPKLHSTSTKTWVCGSLKIIAVFDCPGLKKLPFDFERLPALKNVYGTTEWWETLEWDDPSSKNLLQPYFMDRYAYDPDLLRLGKF